MEHFNKGIRFYTITKGEGQQGPAICPGIDAIYEIENADDGGGGVAGGRVEGAGG